MAITTINQENFETKVTQSSAPVLLDFWACLLYTSDAADELT